MIPPNLIRIAIFVSLALTPTVNALGQIESETIDFYRTDIPINPSDRPLITGIDMDRLVSRWISDLNNFTPRKKLDNLYGLTYHYSIPYPERINKFDPEDVAKLDEPNYCTRYFRIQFGIYPSHKEALQYAITKFGLKACQPTISLDSGFVAFNLWEGRGLIVRDNVYFQIFTKGEDIESNLSVEKIDDALLHDEEAIYRNASFDPPTLLSSHLLDAPVIHIENGGALPVRYSNGQGQRVYVCCRAYALDRDKASAILVRWDEEKNVAVITGPLGIEGVLRIAAANDLGAFAEERSFQFQIVPPGRADAFTQSAVKSAVKNFHLNE